MLSCSSICEVAVLHAYMSIAATCTAFAKSCMLQIVGDVFYSDMQIAGTRALIGDNVKTGAVMAGECFTTTWRIDVGANDVPAVA